MEEIKELREKIKKCFGNIPKVRAELNKINSKLAAMEEGEDTIDNDYISALGKTLDNLIEAQEEILS